MDAGRALEKTEAPATLPMMGSDEVSAAVRQYGQFVWRVLRHQGIPESQLEDLSQEVFVVVLRKLDGFRGSSALRTWIYGICRKVAADARRRRRRKPEQVSDSPPECAVPEGQTEALARGRLRTHLERALAQLDEGTRMVFVLYAIEGMSMAEVAESVGCRLSTAYARLHVARRHAEAVLRAAGFNESTLDLAEVV